MEIKIHFPLDCDKKKEIPYDYPAKALNMLCNVYERLGGGENKKYFFVSRQKGNSFLIRVLVYPKEPLGQTQDALRDLIGLYGNEVKIEFFVCV